VAAGQVLFRIDPRPYEIAVAEAEAPSSATGTAASNIRLANFIGYSPDIAE